MNVGPAQQLPPETEVHESVRQVPASKSQSPSSGNDLIREAPKPQNSSPVPAFVQDEVKVQWDSSDHLMIYQFVNQSGSLVLQVPSEEVLGVARGIEESLQQEATKQEAATLQAASGEGEKPNGN